MPEEVVPDTVCVGWISPGHVDHRFCDSLMGSMLEDQMWDKPLIRTQVSLESGPRIGEARSQVTDQFLTTRCEWLWMVDTDMAWDSNALHRLYDVAKEGGEGIYGGLCFGGRSDSIFPTMYKLHQEDGSVTTAIVEDYPKDQVVKVGATGAAFLLVHHMVFRKMLAVFGTQQDGTPNPLPWFAETVNKNGRSLGEDITFCLRAGALDIPVYVDTRVKIGHMKRRELDEVMYLERRRPAKKKKPLELPTVEEVAHARRGQPK